MNVAVRLPERRRTMQLPDGRALGWSEWGPADGLPVLFCTGAGMSGSLGFGDDVLLEAGVRLLGIDRPGLGLSDPHPTKTLTSWTEDMVQFVDANELNNVTAAGFSQGAVFALALAAREIVKAVAVVSGQDELAHPKLAPLLHPHVAGLIRTIQDDPVDFERSLARMATKDAMWELITGMSSERDRAIYEEPTFSAQFVQCLAEGFAQGPDGYVRDLVNAMTPWPFAVEKITAPVDLWFGALDASTVHSPDFGGTLEQRLPNAWRVVDPVEGGSILWTRAGDILRKLISHVSGWSSAGDRSHG